MKKIIIISLFFFNLSFAEEKEDFENDIKNVNKKLLSLREELSEKYKMAKIFYEKNEKEEKFFDLIDNIKNIKKQISRIEEKWRKDFVSNSLEEGYAFWDQGEITISQLIMEYGASDYLYIIPYEIGSIKLSMFSSIPIPHESWNDMIELILENKGIGIRKLTPYLKELFILKHDLSNIKVIADREEDLEHISDLTPIFFIFSTMPEKIKTAYNFFEKFSDQKQVNLQIVSNKIVIISSKRNVIKLLNLYKAVIGKEGEKKVKVINLFKIDSKEMEKIVNAFFEEKTAPKVSFLRNRKAELSILPLPSKNSVVLVGDDIMIKRAEKIIRDLEDQLEDISEKTIFWYTCKHSDPYDIAEVLNKIYSSLFNVNIEISEKEIKEKKPENPSFCSPCEGRASCYNPTLPVTPSFVQPGKIKERKPEVLSDSIIVDPKTGSILMVINKSMVQKIKELLKKLDVPKKMVQIEVLLVERKLNERRQSGINILKIGQSGNKKETFLSFDDTGKSLRRGILDFVFSKPKDSIPSVDLMMSFLMAQEDLKVNASPSVLAVNQTPATISIVEELSINNGAIQLDTSCGVTVEKSYTRAQFGITIVMTPTIHLSDEDSNKKGYVSLNTDITFDTIQPSLEDRPPATRRHIESEVRIADGETIILGGLRKKSQEDRKEKVPFLGHIPGLGKLFGTTRLADRSTEMFFFITPRIIKDPIEDLKIERMRLLNQRPGDIPEFLNSLKEAKKNRKHQLLKESMRRFFE